MPRRYVKRTARRPRRVARRGRTSRRSAATNSVGGRLRANAVDRTRALTGFPQRMFVTLPYVTQQRGNSGVISQVDQTFNLGSVFDPDFTGTGHQPRGFDEWAAIYGRYRVWGVKAYILMRQRAAHGLIGRVILSNSSGTMATTTNLGEFSNATYIGVTSSDAPPLRKRLTIQPWKVLGMTRSQYAANEDVSALVSASPSESAYLHLVGSNVDGVTLADFEYEITLYFTVEFFDRININQS